MANSGSLYNFENLKKNIILGSYYEHYYLAFDMCFHEHYQMEIMYVTFGETKVEYVDEDGKTKTMSIHSNEYVFIDAGIRHKIIIDNVETRIYNLEFNFVKKSISLNPLSHIFDIDSNFRDLFKKHERVFKASDNGIVFDNILLIQCYVENKKNYTNGDSCLDAMINILFMCIADNYKEYKKKMFGANKVNLAMDYILQNYNDDISLSSIAKHCNVSENHLNNLFMNSFHVTVITYLNDYRIKRACQLIDKSTMTLKQIMLEVGYQNKMSFNRNFKKYIKMTPSQYKAYKKKKPRFENLIDDIQVIY